MTETEMGPLTGSELDALDAWWRAANYLSVGQIYLMANPLLTEPLLAEQIKPRLLGHWGTTPGQNMLYAHLNRIIRNNDLNMIYISGPGHGGPGVVANTYLEGTYSEIYPHVTQDTAGMARLFKQFSFPGGIPSHVAPETPGSIHEGGELGYSLNHAYGAAFDNPDLIVACVIGDGESETGPLAGSWHANKFLDPARDGAVLPILHLNGYKIANPTVPARIPHEELESLLRGYGYTVHTVESHDPKLVHQQLAATMDTVIGEIRAIQRRAREEVDLSRPAWPVIVFKTPKGWTGPKVVDGAQVEGTWRAHQVPLDAARTNPGHLAQLEEWMRSYHAEELFDANGTLRPEIAQLAPHGERRMSANPHANGGLLLRELQLPDFRDYAVAVAKPGTEKSEATRVLGTWLRDVIKANPSNFRLLGPDETASNRLDNVFEVTGKVFEGEIIPGDNFMSRDGRVMEVLSEHLCEGWLEGYVLTGRHGIFACYEAFATIVDSMVAQHAKWLKTAGEIAWRRPVPSLNILLTSYAWRQDHNGYSHQGPGFIDNLVSKKAAVVRAYLPPDANCLVVAADRCLRSRNFINLIIASKNDAPVWLSMDEAKEHLARGASVWEWASDHSGDPQVVLAAAGDVPTLETMAAVWLLRRHVPELRARVVNIIDLFSLETRAEHPHGMDDAAFERAYGPALPIVFAFHGYPRVVHELLHRRPDPARFHVRGYIEEGSTTTPFDMVVRNRMSRYHLALDAIACAQLSSPAAARAADFFNDRLAAHKEYVVEHGVDMPEIADWRWTDAAPA